MLAKSFPDGIARVRRHRALGHRTVLITGALDLVVEPLRPLFDEIVCAQLAEVDGRFTGRLETLPPIGEARALVLADYAEAEGLQLEESMAYADSASDLPMLEAVGFPVAVNPEAKLAAIARRRGWHVEHWHKADGGAAARPAPRTRRPSGLPGPGPHQCRRPGRCRAPSVGGSPAMKSLVLERNVPRFAASRVASLLGSGRGAGIGPLQLLDSRDARAPRRGLVPAPPLLSGICGSDLATLDGRSSRYFEDLVSFPFVPGHEVVGVLDDGGVDHAVGHSSREPGRSSSRCSAAPPGASGRSVPTAPRATPGCAGTWPSGSSDPGLQTGFCTDTGGGWSTAGLVAHASQLHAVPDAFSDEDAVMVEPTACAVHAALSAGVDDRRRGGRGRRRHPRPHHRRRPPPSGAHRYAPCTVVVGAKHAHQRQTAERLGADIVVPPDQLARAVRRQVGSLVLAGRLTGGADVVFDCVGSSESITQALAMVRPRGRVVLVGMPGKVSVDLAPLWHRELTLVGAYAYGTRTGRPTAARAAAHLRTGHRPGRTGRPRLAGVGRLPARAVRGGHRPRRRRRPAWRGEGGLRPASIRKEAPDEPQARIRARRRPLDATDPVLARRAVQPGDAARGQPGHLRPRADRSAVRPRRRPSATRSAIPSATGIPSRLCSVRG